jgi:hypothetical protein
VYAGLPFLWDHAITTVRRLPKLEYVTVWIIILVTALSSLLYAVLQRDNCVTTMNRAAILQPQCNNSVTTV